MRRWLPFMGPALYGVAVIVFWRHHGIPLYGDRVIIWVVGLMLALSLTHLRRFARGFLLEWMPFIVALTLYDLLRGIADGRGLPVHVKPEIWVDKHVFGFGIVPTVFLQQHLWNPARIHWYDWLTWLVYMSHFYATPLLALGLWLWAHDRFRHYAVRVVSISFAAMVTYVLYPAVPPWMVGDEHLLPPVARLIGPITAKAHVLNGYAVYEKGTEWSNNVAAMPSLHEGLALLVSIALWPVVAGLRPLFRRPIRALLVLYPFAMAFALVYSGEHFVTEVVLGCVYTVVVIRVIDRVEARLEARRVRTGSRLPRMRRGDEPAPDTASVS